MPTSPRQVATDLSRIFGEFVTSLGSMWASTPTKETYVVHTNENAPHGTPCGAIAFLIILADMKNGGCEGEVDEQGQEVHDRRDDRGGHDCRVEAELLGQQRKRAADELCKEDRYGHG